MHRSVPRQKFTRLLESIPEKVRADIDLPHPERVQEFERQFLKSNSVMLLAEKNNRPVGVVYAALSLNYYISKSALVSPEDPIRISKIYAYELTGAYVDPEFRREGIYSQLAKGLEEYSSQNGMELYLIVRSHPESRYQALNLLSMLMGRPVNYIRDNYEQMLQDFEGVEIPRSLIEPLQPSIGLVNPESVSLLHRCLTLVDTGEMELIGYWIAAFSPVFKYTHIAQQ